MDARARALSRRARDASWLLVVVGAYLFELLRYSTLHIDAQVFHRAADQLFSGRALHLYADHPDVQIGPLALAAARWLGFDRGRTTPVIGVTSTVLLVLCASGVSVLAAAFLGRPPGWWARAVALTPLGIAWWDVLPSTAHIDDALAITGIVWAAVCVQRGHGARAGLLLGLAIAAKPWAAFALVLLARRGVGRRGLASAAAVSAAAWGPFLLGDLSTLGRLGAFHINASALSLWSVLGFAHAPGFERVLQLGVATVGGVVLVRAHRPDALLAWVFGTRLLLDAGAYPYYMAELLVGLAVVDLVRSSSGARSLAARPILALAALALLQWGDRPLMEDHAWQRLGTIAILLALAVVPALRWTAGTTRVGAERPTGLVLADAQGRLRQSRFEVTSP